MIFLYKHIGELNENKYCFQNESFCSFVLFFVIVVVLHYCKKTTNYN